MSGASKIDSLTASVDLGRFADYLVDLLGGLFGALSSFFFLVILLFFMALDASTFPERLRETRGRFGDALTVFADTTRRYLLVSTVFGLIVAGIDTVVLWLIGVPVPVLWGLLAFITNYIPNVGFVIGLIPPAVLALLEGGLDLMVVVIAAYSVVNFVLQSIVQPKYVGDAVGLSGTVTFVSLVFWAWVLGPLGALLAVPLSLFVKALLVDIDPSLAWVQRLISGGRPASSPRTGDSRSNAEKSS